MSDVDEAAKMLNLLKLNEQTADATQEVETPMELNVELMPHQKRALFWMSKRENPVDLEDTTSSIRDCRGGILSDDQGLGKTLTTLGLCYHNASLCDDSQPWRTLIVCPLSLVNQWKQEIGNRVHSEYRKSVYVYHGAKRTKEASILKRYDFVITTYQTLANEYEKVLVKHPSYEQCRMNGWELPTRNAGAAYRLTWNRVILDEAHQIRNRSTDSWKAVTALRARIRWALTGTPILNEVSDLFALTEFIRYYFVGSVQEWNWKWKRVLESENIEVRERGFKRFQAIIGVVLLRRCKTDKINGEPLLALPEREVVVLEEELEDPEEIALYKAVETKSVIQFNKFLMAGTANQNYTSILMMLLRLRQAVCHPFLIEYTRIRQGVDENGEPDKSLEKAVSNNQAGLSIRSIIENLYDSISDDEEEEEDDVAYSDDDDFIDDRSEQEIMDEKGKMDGEIENEEVAELRKKVRTITISDSEDESSGSESEESENSGSDGLELGDDSDESESDQESDSDDSIQIVSETHSRKATTKSRDVANNVKSSPQIVEIDNIEEEQDDDDDDVKVVNVKSSPGVVEIKDENEVEDIVDHDDLLQIGVKSSPQVLKPINENMETPAVVAIDEKKTKKLSKAEEKKAMAERMKNAVMQPSRKIKVLLEKLEETLAEDPTRKSLIFSQWTSCLDIISYHLDKAGFEYARLEGSMNIAQRNKAINQCRDDPKKLVFLISLHAGGTGLNLTFASQVFIFDVWWNFSKIDQATDRCYRIGQTRSVRVFYFKIVNTVEEKLYEICEKKRETVAGALGEEGSQTLGRQKLTMGDIMGLFSSAAENVISNADRDDGDSNAGAAAAAAARNIIGRGFRM